MTDIATENYLASTPTQNAVPEQDTMTPAMTVEKTNTPTATSPVNATASATVSRIPEPTELPRLMNKTGELDITGGGALAVSEDASWLATSGLSVDQSDFVYLINMNIGELVQSFEKPLAGLTGTTALAFSPNSVYLAAGGHQMAVYVWDIERGNLVYELSYPDMAVLSVDFSDENNFIAAGSAGEKGGVYLWDLVDGSRIEFPIPVLAPDIEFMPNSPILAVATIQYEGETSPHGPILLWDVEEGTFESLLSGEMATSLAFSDDGELLAAAIDGQLRLWNIVEGEEIDVQNQRVSERVFRIDWSPEGHVAALNNDKTISIWGGDGKFVTHFADETIEDFVFIPGNKLVASVFDKPLQVYHILAP